ncbi:hypothetical protein FCM35_KLT19654 [Carex littledalei]|uniref:Phospholipase/carboxylesterase/thioesterase domain-containing protein n=1 Tax=Carex littledalei TaxID=544730 RepID=A0A833R6F7_9POAL|nr:hypothetical protein FCM35_KLT19654 [Carex littledalei]
MASNERSFVLWLHGLGDSGTANEPIKDQFTAPALAGTKWAFPTAPSAPVTCNNGAIMNSWFDICDTPITSKSVRGLDDVLESVQRVHAIVDKEISDGTDPKNIFIAGLSQGGAMAIASVLLYPNTLGGGAVFSGFLPFDSSIEDRISPRAKKTPILWCHGKLDTLVPFQAGEDGKHFLHKLGITCKFKEYPGLGHSLDEMELECLEAWLKHQLQKSNKKSYFSTCEEIVLILTISHDIDIDIDMRKRVRSFVQGIVQAQQTLSVSLLLLLLLVAAGLSFFLLAGESDSAPSTDRMARSFVLWLHGLGDSGPANEPTRSFFSSDAAFNLTKWAFPSAPNSPVSCNFGAIMPSWFDIHEIPISSASPKNEKEVIEAVQKVHAIIDKEVQNGISPRNIFVCGFSQGGALTLASVLLYPETLGGGAVFSGWVPFNSTIIEKISPKAKKTPILWSHGMADTTVLFEAGQAGPPFLQQAGMTCEFKAYPDLGHTITSDEINSLKSWIKSRLKSSS